MNDSPVDCQSREMTESQREVDFAKQKTEGEKLFIAVSPSVKTFGFATSLVRGRRTKHDNLKVAIFVQALLFVFIATENHHKDAESKHRNNDNSNSNILPLG